MNNWSVLPSEDYMEARAWLKKAQNCLLVLPVHSGDDERLAVSALAVGLADAGLVVRVLWQGRTLLPNAPAALVDIVLQETATLPKLSLNFTLSDVPQWPPGRPLGVSQVGSSIVFNDFTILHHGQLPSVETVETKFDLIVGVGDCRVGALGEVWQKNLASLSGVPMINFSNRFLHKGDSDLQVGSVRAVCVSACVAEFLLGWEDFPLTQTVATFLYAGLMAATRNLVLDKAAPKDFLLAAKLLELGAEQQYANSLVHPTLPLGTIQFLGPALEALEMLPAWGVAVVVVQKPWPVDATVLSETIFNLQEWLGGNYPVVLFAQGSDSRQYFCVTSNLLPDSHWFTEALALETEQVLKARHLEFLFGTAVAQVTADSVKPVLKSMYE